MRICVQILSSVVFFAILTFFALVTRAICLCYDDWAAQMLATVTKSTQPSVELKLLDMLKARVALCALVTRKTRVLLLPPMIAVVSLFWSFLEVLIDPRRSAVMDLVDRLLNVTCIQGLPLLFALYVSGRISILENLVSQANLRAISEYLVYAPKEWMLGQKLALSTELLVKAGSAVALLFAFCTMYVTANREVIVIPCDKPYRHFGSCADGFHSGLEQHIDCGEGEDEGEGEGEGSADPLLPLQVQHGLLRRAPGGVRRPLSASRLCGPVPIADIGLHPCEHRPMPPTAGAGPKANAGLGAHP